MMQRPGPDAAVTAKPLSSEQDDEYSRCEFQLSTLSVAQKVFWVWIWGQKFENVVKVFGSVLPHLGQAIGIFLIGGSSFGHNIRSKQLKPTSLDLQREHEFCFRL